MTNKLLLGFGIAIAVFLLGSGVYALLNSKGAPVKTDEAQTPTNASLCPLYSGVSWGTAEATTSPDYGAVSFMQSTPLVNVTDIASKSTPFTTYYHDKLVAAGWTPDMSREAGGPGAEVSVYTKGSQFIVVSFHSRFHVQQSDAPSQCPCDVQFTLMSGLE